MWTDEEGCHPRWFLRRPPWPLWTIATRTLRSVAQQLLYPVHIHIGLSIQDLDSFGMIAHVFSLDRLLEMMLS